MRPRFFAGECIRHTITAIAVQVKCELKKVITQCLDDAGLQDHT